MSQKSWIKSTPNGEYKISTSLELIDRDFIQNAYDSDDVYWAWRLPASDLETLLSNSATLGLYKILPGPEPKSTDSPSTPRTPSPTLNGDQTEHLQQIGMARIVTDHVTTAYLTDVYVHTDYRADGLGKWLIECCNAIFASLPAMRRTMLMASPDVGRKFYTRELGMWNVADEGEKAVCMTRKYY